MIYVDRVEGTCETYLKLVPTVSCDQQQQYGQGLPVAQDDSQMVLDSNGSL
jgi:hypothetical protein